jgi:hypothetical protein
MRRLEADIRQCIAIIALQPSDHNRPLFYKPRARPGVRGLEHDPDVPPNHQPYYMALRIDSKFCVSAQKYVLPGSGEQHNVSCRRSGKSRKFSRLQQVLNWLRFCRVLCGPTIPRLGCSQVSQRCGPRVRICAPFQIASELLTISIRASWLWAASVRYSYLRQASQAIPE